MCVVRESTHGHFVFCAFMSGGEGDSEDSGGDASVFEEHLVEISESKE